MHLPPVLTEDEVREIRFLLKKAKKYRKVRYPAGFTTRVAEMYGVSKRTIQHLITGDRRRNVK